MSIANSELVSFKCLQNGDLVAVSRTLIGKEFHARGPAMEKALSLRRKLVRGIQKSPLKLEHKRVSEQRLQSSVR